MSDATTACGCRGAARPDVRFGSEGLFEGEFGRLRRWGGQARRLLGGGNRAACPPGSFRGPFGTCLRSPVFLPPPLPDWVPAVPFEPPAVVPPTTPAVALSPTPPPTGGGCAPPSHLAVPDRTALAVTSNFETGRPFGCVVSPASDPDGVSMGMIQWNLRAKTLQAMLAAYETRGGQLAPHFGPLLPDLRRLRAMPQGTKAEVQAMIDEARRLRQSAPAAWKAAFLRLCFDPLFCRLQVEDLGRRLRVVRPAAGRLGLTTVRGLCMMFDIQVGDGYARKVGGRWVADGKVAAFAARLTARAAALGRPLAEREKLREIADEASRFAGRWAAERRARRMVIADGTGVYRRTNWDLGRQFPNLDNPL